MENTTESLMEDELEYSKLYESLKDNPEALEELEDIMQEGIDRMTPLVEKYDNLTKKDPSDVSEEEFKEIEEEKYRIETNRLRRIARLLESEVIRKEKKGRELQAAIYRMDRIRHRMENGGYKVYPNDQCPCGSGKKYKKCCGKGK